MKDNKKGIAPNPLTFIIKLINKRCLKVFSKYESLGGNLSKLVSTDKKNEFSFRGYDEH